jgi:lysophospholipase L1-like esterase
MTWKRYVALGDSISIDEYPLRETGIPNIGAASLLQRDLDPIEFDNLAQDGATTGDVLHDQLPHVKPSGDPTLVTITAGGNDMLMFLGAIFPPRDPGCVPLTRNSHSPSSRGSGERPGCEAHGGFATKA